MNVGSMSGYAELHCHSHFSFLDGASPPEVLVQRALSLGLEALALTDHDGLYGSVRFHRAALRAGIRPIVGAEMTLTDESHLTLLARDARGYANLSRLISYARCRQPKGVSRLDPGLLAEHAEGLICLSGCNLGPAARLILRGDLEGAERLLAQIASWFPAGDFAVEVQRQFRREDGPLVAALAHLAGRLGLPVVATGNVHYATREESRLQDVLVCIRHNVSLAEAGRLLRPNSEAYLRSPREMQELFADLPQALENAAAVAERCQVSLDFSDLAVPEYPVPGGMAADDYLRQLCERALPERYGGERPSPPKRASCSRGKEPGGEGSSLLSAARRQLDHELEVIRQTGLSQYFLVVYDIVRHARQEGIRYQGRGSAANSIVAYLLGITAVDPLAHNLLFERFLSVERYNVDHAMPDIDLDFERDRREEIIQYVYQRYGWEHTAMVCTLITFRARSAIRDVGKALGFAPEALDRVAKSVDFMRASEVSAEALGHVLGEDADTERWQLLFDLCRQIDGFPRHLGIHVGGMVVTRKPLVEVVPVEPATMPGRVVIQWDKDSAEDAGLIKIDLLSLAMLSAIGEAVDLIEERTGVRPAVENLTLDDPAVYDLICRGDTIGVFQVESRAQAQMLPRLQPRNFNDLVVEVALVRPGPLQGGMVHPYLRRRRGQEPVRYEHPGMERALADTLGIVVFQEQVLMVARDVAGFSAGEAELLRRAMSRKRSHEEMEALRQRFVTGAMANGIPEEQAHQVYDRLSAFSGFGFNRAHAASFALLTYVSAWLKLYYPLPFYVGLLNNQPMGFYSPSVVVEDAKHHGVRLLPVDVNLSGERCTLEDGAIRLGLNYVHGFGPEVRQAVVSARGNRPFSGLNDLVRRTRLGREALEALIMAGGCDRWGLPRRQLLWRLGRALKGRADLTPPVPPSAASAQALLGRGMEEPSSPALSRGGIRGEVPSGFLLDDLPDVSLPELTPNEALVAEYAFTGVSSGSSPASLYHKALARAGAVSSAELAAAPNGAWVRVGGQVVVRQRPPTAKGFTFITVQDEWGQMNLVLRPDLYPKYRLDVRAPGLLAEGVVERDAGVINVRVERLTPLSPELR
ncbi:MAG: error-prone DNA polymerase [Anaerolineae bacterium]|nr:error-prone DNA polymerase [Anaerolineae bacterium]